MLGESHNHDTPARDSKVNTRRFRKLQELNAAHRPGSAHTQAFTAIDILSFELTNCRARHATYAQRGDRPRPQ